MIAFGADQIPNYKRTSHYIDKFVLVINLASVIETLFDAYIPHQQNYSTVFLVSNSMLVISFLLFVVGWKSYTHMTPYDSSIVLCLPVYRNAFQTWLQHKRTQRGAAETNEPTGGDEQPGTFLDFARVQNNGNFQDRYVDDVKLLRNAFIIVLLVFPYRLTFYQVFDNFCHVRTYSVFL